MSFAKIAEARAVKKIVAYVTKMSENAARAELCDNPWLDKPSELLAEVASRISEGKWCDVVLPKPKKKSKKTS